MITPEQIAEITHNAITSYCHIVAGTDSIFWDQLSIDLKGSTISGVNKVLENPDISAEDLHNEWVKYKISQGWTYGEIRDSSRKIHNCLVPYQDLPKEEKIKDLLFLAITNCFIDK